jgi:mono/diheme cytochrome c family protein
MPTLRQRKLLFLALLAVIVLVLAYALYTNYPWPVPDAAKKMKNPLQPTVSAMAAARAIYRDKCANCHGETGKGDGPEAASHYPPPASFLDYRRMHATTDGELFYRITKGRRPMPAFENRLSDEQRWQLVLLVRAFEATAPR